MGLELTTEVFRLNPQNIVSVFEEDLEAENMERG